MYHISVDGKPRVCKARIQCRLSPADEHYATKEAALEASIDRVLADRSTAGSSPTMGSYRVEDGKKTDAEIAQTRWAQEDADDAKYKADGRPLAPRRTSLGSAERDVLSGSEDPTAYVSSNSIREVVSNSADQELVLKTVSTLARPYGLPNGPARYSTSDSEAVLSSKTLNYEDIEARAKFITTDAKTTARLLEARKDAPAEVIKRLRTPGTVWAQPLTSEQASKIESGVAWSAPEDSYPPYVKQREEPHSQLHARGRLYGDANSYRMLKARLKFAQVSAKITTSVQAGNDVHKLTRELRSADAFLEYNKVQWALAVK